MRQLLFMLALAACGRFQFDDQRRSDGRAVTIDMLDLGPFGSPQLVNEVNDAAYDDDPSLTADGLELYLNSSRSAMGFGNGDLWVARRTSTTMPFGVPVLIPELSTMNDETTPEISADGLTIYFSSDRGGDVDRDLYVATRADRSATWSAPSEITELSSAANEAAARVTADGLLILFASARGAGGTADLWSATRATPSEPWSNIVHHAELSDPTAHEGEQWMSSDGLVVYFGSTRVGGQGLAIWWATRESRDTVFTTPVLVGELDTAGEDNDPWLSEDLRTIYFMSDRGGFADIYMATR